MPTATRTTNTAAPTAMAATVGADSPPDDTVCIDVAIIAEEAEVIRDVAEGGEGGGVAGVTADPMLDVACRNTFLADISGPSFAGTRSVWSHEVAHGSFLQQPRKGGDVKLQVYQALLSYEHSRRGMSAKLSGRKEATCRFPGGQVPRPLAHGSTVQQPTNSVML